MRGLLFDTHPLLWLANNEPLSKASDIAISKAFDVQALFVSPISAWEIGAASTKKHAWQRPALNGQEPSVWFANAIRMFALQLAPFSMQIALESAKLPAHYGSGDPGDCFLIATAHILNSRSSPATPASSPSPPTTPTIYPSFAASQVQGAHIFILEMECAAMLS